MPLMTHVKSGINEIRTHDHRGITGSALTCQIHGREFESHSCHNLYAPFIALFCLPLKKCVINKLMYVGCFLKNKLFVDYP